MKPTKMRNRQIHRAHQAARSKQACSPLSPALRQKYGRRSIRVIDGDSVTVSRGEYRNMQAKVTGVDVRSGTVTLEGLQGEKQRGDKFDVKIHASNLRVTGIHGGDKKRMKSLTGTESALPTSDLAPEPAAESASEPTAKPASDLPPEPTTDQTAEPSADPASEPAADQAKELPSEPTTDQTAEPSTEPASEPTTDQTAEPSAKPDKDEPVKTEDEK